MQSTADTTPHALPGPGAPAAAASGAPGAIASDAPIASGAPGAIASDAPIASGAPAAVAAPQGRPAAAPGDARRRAAAVTFSHPVVQIALLVLVNAFVGAMVGVERAVLPLLGERVFGVGSAAAIAAFVMSFGLSKAAANLITGRLADRFGRKALLVAGWIVGVPVPLLVMSASSWSQVVAANVLLGLNQGLCWSATVIMKIDLAGERRRGLVVGLNEFAGYGALALAALIAGGLGDRFGLRTAPFVFALAVALCGLIASAVLVRDTAAAARASAGPRASMAALVARTLARDPVLSSAGQAGFVANLHDGAAWALYPLLYASAGLATREIAALAALYPGVWGVAQLVTGPLSDRIGRKWLIVAGLWTQTLGVALTASAPALGPSAHAAWTAAAVLTGIGTAAVYPVLIAAVGDRAEPSWRASAIGVYRTFRDLGYLAGGLLAGLIADRFGLRAGVWAVAAVTCASGIVVAARMREPTTSRQPTT